MGKKGKIGKHRKDRFYHLAKETGYRSRAAFKLIQLNRKFEFLQQSKVLIDLCAAPGGWLQVAQKYMPVQSVILGIDLAPIKSIFNVTTLQEDITTQKCRTFISKELKTWKADCVLHDGAPNVGKSWIHDAFEQNRLTLAALHLACDFLMKGGWFVTKVFRSKDYNALMWVFKKLFKRVHATKPQASRNESAEIFVVCQHYLAPDKIDPKFFDASSVFADLREKETTITKGDLLKAITNPKRAKAEGYEEGQAAVYKKLLGSEFMVSKNYIDLLSKSNEIVLDRKDIREHPATTFEVQECIKDLKVLGKKELNLIFNWRTAVRDHLKKTATQENQDQFSDDEVIPEVLEEPEEETEESEEAKKLKRIKRKVSKEKRKLEERLSLKMVLKNDQLIEEEQELFNLADIKRKAAHTIMKDDEQGAVLSDSDDDQPERLKRVIKVKVDKDSADRFYDPDDSDNEIELDEADDDFKPLHFEDDSEEEPEQDQNDMVIDFDTKQDKADELTKRFFENKLFQTRKSTGAKDAADFIEDGDDLELKEIQNRIYKAQKLKSLDFRPSANDDSENEENVKNVAFMDVDGADDAGPKSPEDPMAKFDDDSEDDSSGDDDDDEDGNEKSGSGKVLTPEEMALGAMLVKSKKARREMMDHGWNRYVQEDDDFIPSWFRKEESQFFRKPTPVTEEMVKEYNEKLREINSKPIKKVLEAKQRKKKRAIRKLEKARLKAESITDDADMTNKEKAQYIRSIYKRAVKKNTDKVQLVVGKKQYGKSRPPGVKGRYKIVDSRLKKDKRAQVNKEKTKSRGKKTSSKKPAGKKTPQGGRNKTRTGKGR